jgi:hypothetical protein
MDPRVVSLIIEKIMQEKEDLIMSIKVGDT